MYNLDFPFHIDQRGFSASTTDEDHVRDMVEQVLFTAPGERVNRPDFGSGLLRLVFEPNSPELAAALQYSIRASLQRWLGDLIQVQNVDVTVQDSTLTVLVQYLVRATGAAQTATFQRSNAQ
jgi:phage baseplate assembly protein W